MSHLVSYIDCASIRVAYRLGRHSSILAIPSEEATDAWTVLKVVSTPRAGRSIGSKPHDVYQEVQILDRLSHSNVSWLYQ